jgi:hydrogenase-4 component B
VSRGTPRAAPPAPQGAGPRRARAAMLLLALGCVAVGLAPQWFVALAWPAAAQLATALGAGPPVAAAPTAAWLQSVSVAGLLLVATIAGLWLLRRGLGAKPAGRAATWGCGYALPQSRMQYTASSFAAGLLAVFRRVLWTRAQMHPARGLFSRAPSLHTDTPDAAEVYAYRPAFTALQAAARPFRWLQRGPVQVRILMIMIALGVLLAWKVTLR